MLSLSLFSVHIGDDKKKRLEKIKEVIKWSDWRLEIFVGIRLAFNREHRKLGHGLKLECELSEVNDHF